MNRNVKAFMLTITTTAGIIGAYIFASSYPIFRPIPFDELALSRAAEWVRVNDDPARREGAIALPPRLASVSATGKAYITNGIIFFPSLIGRQTLLPDPMNSNADWIEGYGFSTKSFPTEQSEPASSDNFFYMMDLSDPAHTPDNGDSGRQMAVESRIKKQWYAINSFS